MGGLEGFAPEPPEPLELVEALEDVEEVEIEGYRHIILGAAYVVFDVGLYPFYLGFVH